MKNVATPLGAAGLATLILCAPSAWVSASPAAPPAPSATFADGSTSATSCDPARPLGRVSVRLYNGEPRPSAPVTLTIVDEDKIVGGSLLLATLAAGERAVVSVDLHYTGSGPISALVGTRTLILKLDGRTTASAIFVEPAALCAMRATASSATVSERGAEAYAAPRAPAMSQRTTGRSTAIAAALRLSSPSNPRSAVGPGECAAHLGVLGGLLCPDLIRSGHVLLVWDWKAGAGPDAIDGYHVYRLAGSDKQLVTTQANQQDVTLADIPPSAGAAGTCFGVSAFIGTRESALSAPFCIGQSSAATIARVEPAHVRSHHERRQNSGYNQTDNTQDINVGFYYGREKLFIGDTFDNAFARAALFFDVSALQNRRPVAARLLLRIARSTGQGDQYSCITSVGLANGYWWLNGDQLAADFGGGVPAGDGGPDVAIDVLPIVTRWLRGEPNYGIVLRNDDENLAAFTNKECRTTYVDPTLEITYY